MKKVIKGRKEGINEIIKERNFNKYPKWKKQKETKGKKTREKIK